MADASDTTPNRAPNAAPNAAQNATPNAAQNVAPHPRPQPLAPETAPSRPLLRDKSFWSTLLIGVAVMAAIDEIVFHQILAWHHFYDRSTPAIGLFSDGLLHAASLIALVAGFFLFADARRRHTFAPASAWAGFFVGLGAFQLWDGLIDHKIFRVHQVRYGVELLPYDIAWVAAGLILLAVGIALSVRASRLSARASSLSARASSRG